MLLMQCDRCHTRADKPPMNDRSFWGQISYKETNVIVPNVLRQWKRDLCPKCMSEMTDWLES